MRTRAAVPFVAFAAVLVAAATWLYTPPPVGEQPVVTYPAAVTTVTVVDDCPTTTDVCQHADVEITSGPHAGVVVEVLPHVDGFVALHAGDRLRMAAYPDADGDGEVEWALSDFDRRLPLAVVAGVFVLAVVAALGRRGFAALVGLAGGLAVIVAFVVPAIAAGRSPFAVAVVGGSAVMLISLVAAHGTGRKSAAALGGTLVALTATALLGQVAVVATKLTGLASADAQTAQVALGALDLRGLLVAGLVIGTLGILDDVTVTQASTVFELARAAPDASRRHLTVAAMRVGRDHLTSIVNTLALAYAGASLPLLLLLTGGGVPLVDAVNAEVVAAEVVVTLVGSLGLLLAVPATTVIATLLARPDDTPAATSHDTAGHAHGHADAEFHRMLDVLRDPDSR